jgi:hypothetical protein
MNRSSEPPKKIGLLTITAILAALLWLVAGIVLFVMLRQQGRIESDAQHIFDVSSAKVFEATRTIRGLERLAREGDAITWIASAAERSERRKHLQTLLDDATLQGDPKLRAIVQRAFATLDQNIADLATNGYSAKSDADARWVPVMQEILNQSDAVGTEVSDLAAQEADRILISTESARHTLLWVTGFLALASIVLFGLIHAVLTRPLVRLSKALMQARDGKHSYKCSTTRPKRSAAPTANSRLPRSSSSKWPTPTR